MFFNNRKNFSDFFVKDGVSPDLINEEEVSIKFTACIAIIIYKELIREVFGGMSKNELDDEKNIFSEDCDWRNKYKVPKSYSHPASMPINYDINGEIIHCYVKAYRSRISCKITQEEKDLVNSIFIEANFPHKTDPNEVHGKLVEYTSKIRDSRNRSPKSVKR